MSALMQNNVVNPMTQEAYKILCQLNEHDTITTINFMRKLMENNNKNEEQKSSKKMEAFARLMELREEIAATHPKSLEEERFEAMAEKYPFLRDEMKK